MIMDALTVFVIITCIQIWSVCQIYIIRSFITGAAAGYNISRTQKLLCINTGSPRNGC